MKTCQYCGGKFADSLPSDKQMKQCPICHTDFKTGLPPKPELGGRIIFIIIGVLFIAFPFIVCAAMSYWKMDGSVLPFFLIGAVLIILPLRGYSQENTLYDLAQKNKTEYVRQTTALREKREAATKKETAAREEKLAHLPACPICGSKEHVERITNTDRTVEVAVWGLGASSVGKQYECRKCRHAFNADSTATAVKEDTTQEIRKYKQLLDDGIISQDEFNEKKKQLLKL